MLKCEKCGKQYNKSDGFKSCPYCGEFLVEKEIGIDESSKVIRIIND